jgi:hypothetical protein
MGKGAATVIKNGKKERGSDKEIESQNAHRCSYTPDGDVVHTVI